MANLNQITLVGNITHDPELKWTASGTAVIVLPLAVNTRYRQADEFREETCYVDVTVFGRQAENAAEYLAKGSPVLVQGRLRILSQFSFEAI